MLTSPSYDDIFHGNVNFASLYETLEMGCNVVAGTDPKKILECAKNMINVKRGWNNPFGDGKSGEKIINLILEQAQL